MSRETQGVLLALTAVALWSTVATAFKFALEVWPVLGIIWVASSISLLVFTGYLLWLRRLMQATRLLRRYWRRALFLALLNPVLYYPILLSAYAQLSAQIAQPINYTWAFVLTLIAALWFKAPIRRQDWQAMALGYLGVCVLVIGGQGQLHISMLGVVLAIISTLFWALYWAAGLHDRRPALVALYQHFLLAWPILTLLMLLFQQDMSFLRSTAGWTPAVYLGLAEMGLSFLLWAAALKRVHNTARIANLIFLAPFLSLIWISLFLDEPIVWTTPLALVLILIGQWWQQRNRE